jgi:hypothetical protein
MMNQNKMPLARVVTNETGVENGRDGKQVAEGTVILNRRFGGMDLWKIRSNARTFRIHNRMSRI